MGKIEQAHHDQIRKVFSQNPIIWGSYYFPHHFRSRSPKFHTTILRAALNHRYLAVQCPRESAKTTILSFLYSAWCLAYQKKRFQIIVQNTYSKAAESLNTIKSEFKDNKLLVNDYKIEIVKDSTGDSIFKHPNGHRERILCKGSEQIGSIRGEKFGAYRPDFILCHAVGTKIWENNRLIKIEDSSHDKTFVKSETLSIKVNGVPFKEFITKEHRFMSIKKSKVYGKGSHKNNRNGKWVFNSPGWVEAKDLTKNHWIGTPINYNIKGLGRIKKYFPGNITKRNGKGHIISSSGTYKNIIPKYFMDNEFWWAIGLWWGDGHRTKTMVGWSVSDKNIKNRLIKVMSKYSKYHVHKMQGCEQILFYKTELSKWLTGWKEGNSIKILPKWVRSLEDSKIINIIRGYIDSDGYTDKERGRITITSVNCEGLLILSGMLARLGIPSSIRRMSYAGKTIIRGVECNTQDKYDLYMKENVDILGIDIKKQTRYSIRRTFIDKGFIWHKVENVENGGSKFIVPIKTKSGEYVTPVGLSHNCDDLEDDVMVRSPEQRRYMQELHDNALVPAGDADICQFITIGTILHDDCLMAKLVSPNYYKEYRKLFYRALWQSPKTGKYLSLWNEKWTVKKLINIRATKPDVFAKEYQGNPVSGKLSKFQKDDFRRWYIEQGHYVLLDAENHVTSKGLLSDCKWAIGGDMAWDEKKQSDDTVLMPALLTPGSDLLIDDYFNEKGVRPDQFEGLLFKMVEKYEKITGKSGEIGFEKAMLEKVMKWFLKQAMRRRNKFLILRDMPWVQDKISRIVTPLQPRYKMHTIYHKAGMGELEYQLLRIPSGTHEDLCDAEQIVCRLLEYEPTSKKEDNQKEDPHFHWLRNQNIKKRKKMNPKGTKYIFGQKSSSITEIPSKESWT